MFHFKQFDIDDSHCAMKIGTDGVLLGSWACAGEARVILDVGCGSGLIALMMAQRYPGAHVIGVDIDGGACENARKNVTDSPWSDRIEILHADILDSGSPLKGSGSLSEGPLCIVSNPPFFTEQLRSPDSSRSLARHGEGLNVGTLIAFSSTLMLPGRGDTLSFIAPAEADGDTLFALSLHRLAPSRVTDIVSRQGASPLRRLYEVRPERDVTSPCAGSTLILRDRSGAITPDYQSLTSDYYLHLR